MRTRGRAVATSSGMRQAPATTSGSRPRKFTIPEGAKIALEQAMRADEISGHREGRGTFVTQAVLHAINTAASRNGGNLDI